MKFEEIVPALKAGKGIVRPNRRILFLGRNYRKKLTIKERDGAYEWTSRISLADLMATDWEVVEG
jgi:hypothetical protein